MNQILKIIQGANAGAEIALVEGMNLKLGRGDQCDIILADQALPEVACEIEVGTERVELLLPGGGQERMQPLHVKSFGTTAIAIGPADEAWGTLIWPNSEEEKLEEAERAAAEEKERVEAEKFQRRKSQIRKLQWITLVLLILFVIGEFAVWLFWPQINSAMKSARAWCSERCKAFKGEDPDAVPVIPKAKGLDELVRLSEEYNLELKKTSVRAIALKGNLKNREDRLRITAEAYQAQPGLVVELSDDETLKNAANEILSMIAGRGLVVSKAENRRIALTGQITSLVELQHVLEALEADVTNLDAVDCSQVVIAAQLLPVSVASAKEVIQLKAAEAKAADAKAADAKAADAKAADVKAADAKAADAKAAEANAAEAKADDANAADANAADVKAAETKAAEAKAADVNSMHTGLVVQPPELPKGLPEETKAANSVMLAELPFVGLLLQPVPCLITRSGSRIIEGAEFGGFIVRKIGIDHVLLYRNGQEIEWRP